LTIAHSLSDLLLRRQARLCVDYRALNNQTIKKNYALPRFSALLEQQHGERYFSKIDLASGNHQVQIKAEDEVKTHFRAQYGHSGYTTMPFGLCNPPATFMRLINDVFGPLLDKCVVDDLLVNSCTAEEHKQHVRHMLQLADAAAAEGKQAVHEVIKVTFRIGSSGFPGTCGEQVADCR
jgi:hypothetical protein